MQAVFSVHAERGPCSSWKRLVIVVQLVKPHLIILEFSERRVEETQFKWSDSYVGGGGTRTSRAQLHSKTTSDMGHF